MSLLNPKSPRNVQIALTKFRSENPEFLKDDKGFQNIKENVTITDVNESIKFENDWINLLLDPEDAYPDTNINLKKNDPIFFKNLKR